MKTLTRFLWRLWQAGAFSATAFLVRAVILTLLFGVSQLFGLKEYTTFLSGTSANLDVSWQTAATFGLIHLLLYVGFILVVPVFLITASMLFVVSVWRSWFQTRQTIASVASSLPGR